MPNNPARQDVVLTREALVAALRTVKDPEIPVNIYDQGFEFSNPNIRDMCGCGESFSV